MAAKPADGTPYRQAYDAEASLRPLRLLTDAVVECVEAGVFRPVDPAHAARVPWASSWPATRARSIPRRATGI